jgi:mannosyltransferase
MRLSSTDQTAVIIRIPAQAPPPTGPQEWKPSSEDIPPDPEPLEAPRLTVAAWAIPVIATAVIALVGLSTPGLGEDELVTWGMATASWADFRAVLSNVDASVGPYYVLLRLLTSVVGSGDLALRVPSVLFATGTAGLVAGLGIRLGGRRVGLAAGLIFAVVPMTSRYAQEARPYALTLFAATLATFLLVRAVDQPRFGRYLAYTTAVVLLGSAHAVALLLLFAHAVIAWQLCRTGRGRAGWLAAATAGVLPVLPLLYIGRQQSGTQIGWIPPLTWDRLADTPDALFGGAVLAGAVMALALAAMSMRAPVVVATAWAVVPVAGLAAAAQFTPLWVPRYLLFVLPGWALLASLALRRLTVLRGLVAVLGIGLLALPVQFDVRAVGGHGLASSDVAKVLRSNALPGDSILYGPFEAGDQRTSRDAVMRYLETDERPTDALMQSLPRTDGRLGARECLDSAIPACFGRPERVWVVRKSTSSDPLQNIGAAKEQLLRQGYVASRSWRLTGFTVALFVRKPAV